MRVLVCLILYSFYFTVAKCSNKTIAQKYVGFLKVLNPNGDDTYSTEEAENAFRLELNSDFDDCIYQKEFVKRLIRPDIGFTSCFAKSLFEFLRQADIANGYDDPSCSGIFIRPDPNPEKVEFIYGNFILALSNFCESNPKLYRSNEDCRQLPLACRFSTDMACNWGCWRYNFNVTRDRFGNIPFKDTFMPEHYSNTVDVAALFDKLFKDLGPAMEPDAPPVVISDPNNDGCLNRYEFMGRFAMPQCGLNYGYTPEHAEQRFIDISRVTGRVFDPNCDGIIIADTNFKSPSVREFKEHNLQSMINMCEADQRRYQTNRDCRQIFRVCSQTDHRNIKPCKEYINNVLLGRAGYSFDY